MEDSKSTKIVNNYHSMPEIWKITQKNRGKPLCYLSSISSHEAPSTEVDAKSGLTRKPHPKFEHVTRANSQFEFVPSAATSEMPMEMLVVEGALQTFDLGKSK